MLPLFALRLSYIVSGLVHQDVSQSLASSLGCYGDKDDRLFDDKITDGKMTPAVSSILCASLDTFCVHVN